MAKNSPFSGWQIFFSKTNLAYFFFGAIVMSVLSKAIYDLLIINLGNSQTAILGIGIGTFAIMFLVLFFKQSFLSWQQTSPLTGTKTPETRKGLILLVSNEEVCTKALDFHLEKLTHCWLICTKKSESTAKH